MGWVSNGVKATIEAAVAAAVLGLGLGCGAAGEGEADAPETSEASAGTMTFTGGVMTGASPMPSTGGSAATSQGTDPSAGAEVDTEVDTEVGTEVGTEVDTERGGQQSGDETSGGLGCVSDTRPGERRFDCGHLTFDIAVPARCGAASCGLIIDVHGRTMSAQMQEANTHLRALGMQRGYVVIQPNSNPAPPLSSWDGAIDDATVVDVVEEAASVFDVDPDRVHLTGFSQGGSMTWRLLADYGELWASAAPAAACGIGLPSVPVPVLYMHGTADALTAYDCAEPYVDMLLEHYGLEEDGEIVEAGEDHVRLRYGDIGPALVEVLWHDYDNGNAILGGHCYPGSDDPGGAPGQLFTFACGGGEAFAWGETVLDFFDAHPRITR